MALTASQISALVEAELARIPNPSTIALIRRLLVQPRCEKRPWDYGSLGDRYPCWIIGEHPSSNTAFTYCEQGFGPKCPWGLLGITGEHLSMGMDSSWFTSLEAAVRDSWAWEAPTPQELDESVYELLEAIRYRPGMYIVEPSIYALSNFLGGYSAGLGRVGFALREGTDFHRFHDWVAHRLGFSGSTSGWCNMIREKSKSDADAFQNFFVLLDEFRKGKEDT
jgi:hypothetical protein